MEAEGEGGRRGSGRQKVRSSGFNDPAITYRLLKTPFSDICDTVNSDHTNEKECVVVLYVHTHTPGTLHSVS